MKPTRWAARLHGDLGNAASGSAPVGSLLGSGCGPCEGRNPGAEPETGGGDNQKAKDRSLGTDLA